MLLPCFSGCFFAGYFTNIAKEDEGRNKAWRYAGWGEVKRVTFHPCEHVSVLSLEQR